MSRPANPSWAVPVWAPNANYSAGANPWSGTPTKTTHPAASTVGITPKQGVAAQVFNKVLNDAYAIDQSAKDTIAALVTHTGQVQPRNWSQPSTTNTITRIAFDPNRQIWYGLGTSGSAWFSGDAGKFWMSFSIGGGYSSGTAIAADPSGNAVVISGGTVFDFTKATNVWAARAAVLAGTPTHVTSNFNVYVTWEPGSSLWSTVYYDPGLPGIRIYTSANRAAWTNRTVPAAVSTGWSPCGMAVGNGRIVVMAQNTVSILGSTTSVKMLSSTDGGITWADNQTIAFAGGTGCRTAVAYSSVDNAWLAVMANTTTGASDVYRSTDGTTWTRIVNSTIVSFQRIAAVGRLWVAIADRLGGGAGDGSNVLYSYDVGATWRLANVLNGSGFATELLGGGGALVALCNQIPTGVAAGHTRGSIVCDEGPTVTV